MSSRSNIGNESLDISLFFFGVYICMHGHFLGSMRSIDRWWTVRRKWTGGPRVKRRLTASNGLIAKKRGFRGGRKSEENFLGFFGSITRFRMSFSNFKKKKKGLFQNLRKLFFLYICGGPVDRG